MDSERIISSEILEKPDWKIVAYRCSLKCDWEKSSSLPAEEVLKEFDRHNLANHSIEGQSASLQYVYKPPTPPNQAGRKVKIGRYDNQHNCWATFPDTEKNDKNSSRRRVF